MNKQQQEIDVYVNEFNKTGTVMMPIGVLFSESELDELNLLQNKLPEEYVELGDAGEPNDLFVRRVMVDYPGILPQKVNSPISDNILKILDNEEKHHHLIKFIKRAGYIRRCQINRMVEGSFIGLHLDIDSNPDYLVSVVIQLGTEFSGGEFITSKQDGTQHYYMPDYGSVIISDCKIPHLVNTVDSNERVSLVYFYSFNDGINQNSS